MDIGGVLVVQVVFPITLQDPSHLPELEPKRARVLQQHPSRPQELESNSGRATQQQLPHLSTQS
jgi:hypothetical protein